MSGFNKLFSSIVTSSIWTENDKTLRVWIAMIATMNASGIVEGSIPGFANLARVSVEEMQKAEEVLLSPDPFSRSKENEGRRIERIPGGWQVLNSQKYREKPQTQVGSRADYYRLYRERKKEQQGCNNKLLRATKTVASPASVSVQEGESVKGGENPVSNPSIEPTLNLEPESTGPTEKELAEQIYQAYPRKVGKPNALKSILKQSGQYGFDKLLKASKTMASLWSGQDMTFCPHPATWFNQERFNDDPSTWGPHIETPKLVHGVIANPTGFIENPKPRL